MAGISIRSCWSVNSFGSRIGAVSIKARLIWLTIAIVGAFDSSCARAQSSGRKWLASTRHSEADRRGDFSGAVQSAEGCLAVLAAGPTEAGKGLSEYFCKYYLGSALRKGRGVPRDEQRAFDLLDTLAGADPDGDAALDVAEMYLSGEGISRDPIEAAVIVWRVRHGAWSFYSPYWGMCNNCEGLWAHEKAFQQRLDRELTSDEKQQAEALGTIRFPEVAARVRNRDRQVAIGTAFLIALIGGTVWLCRRFSTRSISNA
jgi:hypothetical protein